MTTTLQILESAPASWPAIPGLPADLDAAVVWLRLESWIAWRWGERECAFVVEGPGEWTAPFTPFTTTTIEVWHDGEWELASVAPTPCGGYELGEVGPFRFTGLLGDVDDPPSIVLEAARRLGTYLVQVAARDFCNVVLSKEESADVDSFEFASPNVAARAISYSGAGDLLRRYRRLGA